VVELYGGKVDRVGKDGPRVNPFALEPTESNIKFLYSFVKLLLTNGGAELEPEDDEVVFKAVQDTVIHEVLTSRDRVHGLQGLAGTGKTTTLEAIRDGAEKNGYTVEGFAPTSRAAGQLREAGVSATTLQSFLVRGGQGQTTGDPNSRHLYLLDESSLASTQQMKAFLDKIRPQDRVLVIGDTQQHQGVEAGKPFQQMQDGGMRTAQLDQIMRQKDPELLKAVEHLAKNETAAGVKMLAEQGRVTELSNAQERIAAIAKDYAVKPENTIIVSPDNRSRQQINQAVRTELQAKGTLAAESLKFDTLTHRSDMTGADRTWAVRYQPGNVVEYTTGSKDLGIQRGSSAAVLSTNARDNTVTVQRTDGQTATYNPTRLRGVNVYQVTEREFASGDRLQFTSPDKKLGIVRRDLGTVTKVEANEITVRMDGKDERAITFDPTRFRAFDHGYAITSYSAQGLTAGRVIANIDTDGRADSSIADSPTSLFRGHQRTPIFTQMTPVPLELNWRPNTARLPPSSSGSLLRQRFRSNRPAPWSTRTQNIV